MIYYYGFILQFVFIKPFVRFFFHAAQQTHTYANKFIIFVIYINYSLVKRNKCQLITIHVHKKTGNGSFILISFIKKHAAFIKK